MTPEQLAEKILQALAALADDGTITVEGGLPRELKVERPKNPEHGDYATNVAMQLGKRSSLGNPRKLAELLAAKGDALRPGLTEDEAADVIFTLLSPEVYLLLTVGRGWPPARWQHWTAGTIALAILRLPLMAACMRPVAALATVAPGPLMRDQASVGVLA